MSVNRFIIYNRSDGTFGACRVSPTFGEKQLPIGTERYKIHLEERWAVNKMNHLLSSEMYEEGWHYIGTELSVSDIKECFPEDSLLAFVMEHKGWTKVVRTPWGNYYPLNEHDQVHAPSIGTFIGNISAE